MERKTKAMGPAFWLILLGLLVELAAVIGYFVQKNVVPLPVWIPALFIIGWVLILIGFIYMWMAHKKVDAVVDRVRGAVDNAGNTVLRRRAVPVTVQA